MKSKGWALLAGAGLGAGLMYALDPDRGKRRRAMLRDKANHALNELDALLGSSTRDLAQRTQGMLAEMRGAIGGAGNADDERVASRVRTEIGRVVSHPRAIDISVTEGVVLVRGPVLEEEVEPLLGAIKKVPGVVAIKNWLRVPEHPEEVSALQGGVRRRARTPLLRARWSPAMRLLLGSTGLAAVALGAEKRGRSGVAMGAAGALLLARSASNRSFPELFGWQGGEGIDVQKTLNINAPVSDLYEFWVNPENYALVFDHVKEVKKVAPNLYDWTVYGPAGMEVRWEGVIVEKLPNQLICWKSIPGSEVGNEGVVRLDPNYDGSTRVHIQMKYQPPAGMLGHAIAELFGTDPKHALDADLARLKSLFEIGKTRVHGQKVVLEEIGREKKISTGEMGELIGST
jgi:uncharacterized membrane protein